jgi:hypothetical protein
MSDLDVHGPIDFVLIEFPGDSLKGEVADQLLDLVARGVIRIYDVLAIRKESDGSFSSIELSDVSQGQIGRFSAFAGARSGLLNEDDLLEAASAMDAGSVAVLLVYENAWAVPFVAAALGAGGDLIASARIPATDVMDMLDALETAH